MTEISRVLFGLRKGDLYIAIERRGEAFVLIHEQAIGGSVVKSHVEMSPGAAKRFADAIAKEIADDEIAAMIRAGKAALATAGDAK